MQSRINQKESRSNDKNKKEERIVKDFMVKDEIWKGK